ncbi:MAG: M48 family metalloprotease [Solibacillus sp.]
MKKKVGVRSSLNYKKDTYKKKDIDTFVKEHNAQALKDYVNGNGPVFFINNYIPNDFSEFENTDAAFYRSYCNLDEIRKILNMQSSDDFLLKLRADAIVDEARLVRVITQRKKSNEKEWNFTDHFIKKEFDDCISMLSEENQEKIKNVSMGFVFSKECNGACIASDFGNVITVSESLRYFLYFMNLFFIDFSHDEIDFDTKFEALLIGIRTMLGAESLDFELDPRGKVPDEIENLVNSMVSEQLRFIILHEFSHHLLNHLETKNLIRCDFIPGRKGDIYQYYKNSHQQEFEADKKALELLEKQDDFAKENYLICAIMFFIYIDIFEFVQSQIYPSSGKFSTHPSPEERIWNLFRDNEQITELKKENIQNYMDYAGELKKELEQHIACNIELYENYGSIYLSKWREKVLIDRIDY